MKLYCAADARARRPRWMLEELGVPCEIVMVDRPPSPAVGAPAASPTDGPDGALARGERYGLPTPLLVDELVTIAHPSAICAYLADKYLDRKLAPPPGDRERRTYLHWLSYAAVRLEPVVVSAVLAELNRDRAGFSRARARFAECAYGIPRGRASEYLLGDAFTAADLVIGSILDWARAIELLEAEARLVEYLERVTDRDAFRRAHAD